MDLAIKGLKYMDGPDGLIFQYSVYVDGKRRFMARNDGNGGCHAYDPVANGHGNWAESLRCIRDAEAWAKTLPSREITLGQTTLTVESDLDQVIDDLVFAEMERRQLKAWCRNATVFRTEDTPEDQWRSVNHVYTPEVRDWIHARYPGAEIANERF